MTLKEQILEKVNKYDNVSFAEICEYPGFNGDLYYGNKEYNIFYWFSISQEAVNSIEELITEGLIEMKPTHERTYLLDGVAPTFPIVKQKRKYKTPRWMPIILVKANKNHSKP